MIVVVEGLRFHLEARSNLPSALVLGPSGGMKEYEKEELIIGNTQYI